MSLYIKVQKLWNNLDIEVNLHYLLHVLIINNYFNYRLRKLEHCVNFTSGIKLYLAFVVLQSEGMCQAFIK